MDPADLGVIVDDLQSRALAYTLLRKYPLAEQGSEAVPTGERWGKMLGYPFRVTKAALEAWEGMAR